MNKYCNVAKNDASVISEKALVSPMAYLGLPSAVVGIEPLTWDEPSPAKLKKRLLPFAIHELGRCLGLEPHGCEDDIDSVMIGDEEVDSVEGIDRDPSRKAT